MYVINTLPFICVCVCVFVPVEWTVSVLKVLSELSPILLVHENDGNGGDGQGDEKKKKMEQEGGEGGEIDDGGQVSSVMTGSLLPRSVSCSPLF